MTDFQKVWKISNSEVGDFASCQAKHFYKYGLKLRLKRFDSPLQMGIIGHEMAAAFMRSLRDGSEFPEAMEAADTVYDDWQDFPVDRKAAVFLGGGRMMKWFQTFWKSPWEVIGVEEKVETHVDAGDFEYIFPLRYDVLVKFNDGKHKGKRALVDWKWTYDFWRPQKLQTYVQLSKYRWAINREIPDELLEAPVALGVVAQIRYRTDARDLFSFEEIDANWTRENNAMAQHTKFARQIIRFRNMPRKDWHDQVSRSLGTSACDYCHYQNICTDEVNGRDPSGWLIDYVTEYKYGYNND